MLLQEILQRQLLWLACRHHILELLVKAAYNELFGNTKSPEVKLFMLLKDPATWSSLDLMDLRLPTIPRAYKDDVDTLLSSIFNWQQLFRGMTTRSSWSLRRSSWAAA